MREVSERDLRAVSRFLRTPGLSRQVIGDLLGENCEHCKRLLVVFASTFEFRGQPSRLIQLQHKIAESLRLWEVDALVVACCQPGLCHCVMLAER